jgi:hypothetical protein
MEYFLECLTYGRRSCSCKRIANQRCHILQPMADVMARVSKAIDSFLAPSA